MSVTRGAGPHTRRLLPRFLESLSLNDSGTSACDPNRTSRAAVLDSPQTRGIFVLDGGLLDSTLVRAAAVASAGMYDYALPQVGPNGRSAARSCPSSFASESISRTSPDTRQRHGAFDGLARWSSSSGVPWRSEASETGDGSTGRFHRGPKRFVAARLSGPKSTQKPQSRGGATIAMNYWPEKLRSGVEPPSVAPSSNKRSPRSSMLISYGLPKKLHGWAIRVGHSDESLLRRGP